MPETRVARVVDAENQIFPTGTTVRKKGQKRWLGEVIREREDKGGRYVEVRSARNGGVLSVAPEMLVAKRMVKRRGRKTRA